MDKLNCEISRKLSNWKKKKKNPQFFERNPRESRKRDRKNISVDKFFEGENLVKKKKKKKPVVFSLGSRKFGFLPLSLTTILFRARKTSIIDNDARLHDTRYDDGY